MRHLLSQPGRWSAPAAGADPWPRVAPLGRGASVPAQARYARRLSWTVGAIIGGIALLAIVGQINLQDVLARQAEADELATLARAHHEQTRVVSDGASALAAETDPARRLTRARELGDQVATWTSQHGALDPGEAGVLSAAESDRARSWFMGVTPQFQAIDRAVRGVVGAVAPDGRLTNAASAAPLAAAIEANESAYLAGIVEVGAAYDDLASGQLGDLRHTGQTLLLLTLGVLALAAVLVFGPALRWLRRCLATLRRAETEAHQLGDIIAASSDAVVGVTLDGRIVSWNGGAAAVYGRSGRESIGMPVADLVQDAGATSTDPLLSTLATLRAGGDPGGPVRFVAVHRHRDGGAINVSCAVSPLRDGGGSVIGMSLISRDETEANLLRGQLAFQALHDPLTETPNRTLFRDRLHQATARATRRGTLVGVLTVDIDAFRFVNDRHGHEVGDGLLRAVSHRVGTLLRASDTLARVTAGQFAILLDDLADGVAAEEVAHRVMAAFADPFTVDSLDITISASAGLAVSRAESSLGPAGTAPPDDLLHDAEAALANAKRGGKGSVVVFERAMTARARSRLRLESELRSGIRDGELVVHYQPVIHFTTGRITEMEALVRWQHPRLGLLDPSDFIGLAEESGLTLPLGRWVLNEACDQARAWQRLMPERETLVITVNVSARQFGQTAMVRVVEDVLAATGLDAGCLKLEISEMVATGDVLRTMDTLVGLKRLGVGLAIDDFGTGYSGLEALRRCAVDTLKIDREFVARLGADERERAVVGAIVNMGRALGMRVMAAGVERVEQLTILTGLGCDGGQGYLFAKPLPAEEVTLLLGASPRWSMSGPVQVVPESPTLCPAIG
ncbi:MAG: EAL domain-containing protein [Chloroflexota bacterium]|nr:EAL domain-containing protein [Chloroflexota bacterium]